MENKETYETILLAAGAGTRLGAAHNKVLLPLGPLERPMFDYALREFLKDQQCERIILVVRKIDKHFIKGVLKQLYTTIPDKIQLATGGDERQYSVAKGLELLRNEEGYVMIHDAARPFIDASMLENLFAAARKDQAAIIAIPARDTIKRVNRDLVQKTLPRSDIWQAQTPQAFKSSLLLEAYKQAEREGYLGNEEGELMERRGFPVTVVQGNPHNFKITTEEDLELAESLLTLKYKKDKGD